MPAFIKAGGKLKVCKACMIHNGVKEEDLIAESIIITAPDVIDLLMESKKSLQLN
ncbi:MAG: DsrE family protein [Wohlfahrtiimonas sp.]